MKLEGIIAISGKPGLYKIVSQGNKSLIVEHLDTGRKGPAFATDKVSSLDDISIFGHVEDLPLGDVFQKIFDFEKGKATVSHKSSGEELRDHFEKVWPDYNDEEVRDHDIRKVFQWYNLLLEKDLLKPEEEEAKEEIEEAKVVEGKKETKEEKDKE